MSIKLYILLIQTISITALYFSFKMYETGESNINTFFEHSPYDVCRFGKVGAWSFLFWSIFLTYNIFFNYQDRNILGKYNLYITLIIFTLSLLMNPNLWSKSILFFLTQFLISYTLIYF